MGRIYVNSDEVQFVKKDSNLVDAVFYDGAVIEDLEPRRLFPISGLTKYITLLDSDEQERIIIRNVENLMPESRRVIEESLAEYYMIPKIKRLIDSTEKYGIIKWEVETDRGPRSFDIKNRHYDIKTLYDGRILVRDSNDNRYEIPDYTQLDSKSRRLLISEL